MWSAKATIDTLQIQGSANGTCIAKNRRRRSGGKTRGTKHTVETTGLSTRLSSSVSGGVDDELADVQEVLNHTISDNNGNDCGMSGTNLDLSQTDGQQGQVVSFHIAKNSQEVTNSNTIPCWPRGETSVEDIAGIPNASFSGTCRAVTTLTYKTSALNVNADRSVKM